MKKIILSMVAILSVFISALSVSADTIEYKFDKITMSMPSKYTVLYPENLSKNKETVQSLGTSVETMKKDFSEKGIIFIAVNSENNEQFEMRSTETEYSKEIASLSKIKDDEIINKIGSVLFGNNSFGQYSINGCVYLRENYTSAEQNSVIYVTIENGCIYTFSYFGDDPVRIAEIIGGLRIGTERGLSAMTVSDWIRTIIVYLLIAGLLVAVILIVVSLIRDFKRRKNENVVSEYIKIRKRF